MSVDSSSVLAFSLNKTKKRIIAITVVNGIM